MKYTKSDIRQVIQRLVLYFRKQEDTSSNEEMSELWERIERTIDIKRRKRIIYMWSSISAAALITGFVWLGVEFFSAEKEDLSVVAASMLEDVVETDEIQLIVAPQKTLQVKDRGTVTYSKDGEVKVDEDEVVIEEKTENLYDQIIVPKGRFGQLVLADGSQLYINSGTKVVYPKRFDDKRREIFVDGEIYIDVKRNEKVPFVVKTARFDVEVLGTAFDVKAYSDYSDNGEIVLLRGLVNVKSLNGEEMKLVPDNKAVVSSEGEMRSVAVDAADYILWTKGILPLRNGTVGEILKDLSRYYDIEVNCNDNIKNVRITGKIDLQKGAEEALHYLSVTGGFVCEKKGETYVLSLEKN